MSAWEIVTSGEFAAALGGAGAAFLLEAVRRRLADNSRQQAGINLALLTLSQMHTVLKNFHDQVFVDTLPILRAQLGRDPLPFEYRGVSGLADEDLKIDFEHFGNLLVSHDPGVLQAIFAAERIYLTNRMLMREHAELHREFQRRIAATPAPVEGITVGAIRHAVGPDLFKQLEDVVAELHSNLPRDYNMILGVANRLLEVAKIQFPARRFIRFGSTDRFPVNSDKPTGQPASWRLVTRWMTDQIRYRRYARRLVLVGTLVVAFILARCLL